MGEGGAWEELTGFFVFFLIVFEIEMTMSVV